MELTYAVLRLPKNYASKLSSMKDVIVEPIIRDNRFSLTQSYSNTASVKERAVTFLGYKSGNGGDMRVDVVGTSASDEIMALDDFINTTGAEVVSRRTRRI